MFDPDLGYYFRAIRDGKRLIAFGALVGAICGLVIGTVNSGRDWEARQSIRVDVAAISPTIDDRGFLSLPELPDRKVLDEAALARVLQSDLRLAASMIVVPNEAAESIQVIATAGSKGVVSRDLQRLLDAYQKDRTSDYDRRLAVAVNAVAAQQQTSQASLSQLDAEIAASSPATSVLAQALVSQRAAIADSLEASTGAQKYLADFRQHQTGGTALIGNPEFSQQPPTGSGLSLAVVLGLLGAVVGAVVTLIRRIARRRIESAADLALFSEVVSVGELAGLEPQVLGKIAGVITHDAKAGRVVVTESLVGTASSRLHEAFVAQGIDAVVSPALRLPRLNPADRVVVAVDRTADTEQSVEDLLHLLVGVVPLPVLAVLC